MYMYTCFCYVNDTSLICVSIYSNNYDFLVILFSIKRSWFASLKTDKEKEEVIIHVHVVIVHV